MRASGLPAFIRAHAGRWAPIAAGLLASILLAFQLAAAGGDARGLATTRVLVDTPQNQLIESTSGGVTGLAWRATVLGELLGTEPARERIAAAAGIPVAELAVVDPRLALPHVAASLPRAASEAAVPKDPYVLTTRTDGVLPLVSIRARGPDREAAASLAEAAAGQLKSGAGLGASPDTRRFVVERVAPVSTRDVPGGLGALKTVIVSAAFFGLWCAGVALIRLIVRRRPTLWPSAAGSRSV